MLCISESDTNILTIICIVTIYKSDYTHVCIVHVCYVCVTICTVHVRYVCVTMHV